MSQNCGGNKYTFRFRYCCSEHSRSSSNQNEMIFLTRERKKKPLKLFSFIILGISSIILGKCKIMVWNCGFVDEAYSKVCFEEPREEGLSVFSKLTLLLLVCVHVLNDHFTGEKIG